jgi:hypothetical protein
MAVPRTGAPDSSVASPCYGKADCQVITISGHDELDRRQGPASPALAIGVLPRMGCSRADGRRLRHHSNAFSQKNRWQPCWLQPPAACRNVPRAVGGKPDAIEASDFQKQTTAGSYFAVFFS